MAAPTITSVATANSANGGNPNGGDKVTITGTAFTGATAVNFGNLPATFKVESATEIKATVPTHPSINQFYGEVGGGGVAVFVTTPEGTNAEEAGDIFVYWPPNTVSGKGGRQYETVSLGAVKGTGAANPVSYLKAGAAEEFKFTLYGDYSGLFADNILLEVNVVEATGTPKLKVLLESSVDGGASWIPVPGVAEAAELNAAGKAVVEGNSKEKPFGPKLRANCKFGAAGGVAGTLTVVTDHA